MKIKIIILENDSVYLTRITSAFNVKYAEKLEVYSFTDKDAAIEFASKAKVDVFLANDQIDIEVETLPSTCGFAYLVDSAAIESIKNEVAICKFQKVELIYKQILSVFSEKMSNITGLHLNDSEEHSIIIFTSPAGGVGSSVAAAACAMYFAKKGKKVLYLNFEKYGSSDVFFSADGVGSLGDIIYALKSRKGNLSIKLESTVKCDASGVYFFSATRNVLDIAELTSEEKQRLLKELKMFGGYDYIIVDMDFGIDADSLKLLQEANKVVFVSDGSEMANTKLERVVEALQIIEEQGSVKVLLRSGIMYNRFSSQTSKVANVSQLKEYGGIKRFEGLVIKPLLEQISAMMLFDNLA